MRRLLARVDETSALIERVVVLTLLVLMACVVFFDVVHRVASSPEGIILRLLTAMTGGSPSESTLAFLRSTGVPAACALLTFFFYFGALRTTSDKRSVGVAAGIALASTIGTGLALAALLRIFPNGLVWSQPVALAMLLWVALFGASLVTRARGHIAFEVADKIWPKKVLPYARLVSGLVAAAFCLVIVVLAFHYVSDFYAQWKEDGVGYVSGVPLPKWVAYLAIPVGFLIMGLRFLGYAIGDFLYGRGHEAEVQS